MHKSNFPTMRYHRKTGAPQVFENKESLDDDYGSYKEVFPNGHTGTLEGDPIFSIQPNKKVGPPRKTPPTSQEVLVEKQVNPTTIKPIPLTSDEIKASLESKNMSFLWKTAKSLDISKDGKKPELIERIIQKMLEVQG